MENVSYCLKIPVGIDFGCKVTTFSPHTQINDEFQMVAESYPYTGKRTQITLIQQIKNYEL